MPTCFEIYKYRNIEESLRKKTGEAEMIYLYVKRIQINDL
jgi:hypothetical protein